MKYNIVVNPLIFKYVTYSKCGYTNKIKLKNNGTLTNNDDQCKHYLFLMGIFNEFRFRKTTTAQ